MIVEIGQLYDSDDPERFFWLISKDVNYSDGSSSAIRLDTYTQ